MMDVSMWMHDYSRMIMMIRRRRRRRIPGSRTLLLLKALPLSPSSF